MRSPPHHHGGRLFILWWLLWLPGGLLLAQDFPTTLPDSVTVDAQQAERRRVLAEEAAGIQRSRQALEAQQQELPQRVEGVKVGQLTAALVEQAQVDVAVAQLALDDVQADLVKTDHRLTELEKNVRELEAREQLLKNPAKDSAEGATRAEQLTLTRQTLAQQQIDLELERQHRQNLRDRLALARLRLTLAQQWQARVNTVYRTQQEQSSQAVQKEAEQALLKTQQDYRDQAETLRQQYAASQDDDRRQQLETRLQEVEERDRLAQLDLELKRLDSKLAPLTSSAAWSDAGPDVLRDKLDELEDLLTSLHTTAALLQRRADLLQQQRQVLEAHTGASAAEKQVRQRALATVNTLVDELQVRQTRLQTGLEQTVALKGQLADLYRRSLRANLLSRAPLLTTLAEWPRLPAGLADAPSIVFYQVRLSVEAAGRSMFQAEPGVWLLFITLQAVLLWQWLTARRRLQRLIERLRARQDTSFLGTTGLTLAQLLRHNLWSLYGIAVLGLLLPFFQIPAPGRWIILAPVLLTMGFRLCANLAWLLLAAPTLPEGKQQPQLYRQVFWLLLVGSLLATVTALAHLSELPEPVSHLCDWLFMALELVAVPVALRLRRRLVDVLAERYGSRFWFRALRLVSLLLPLALLVTALLGLAGYLNLAWTINYYLLLFLLVLAGWLVARGVLNDLVVVLKNYAMTHSGYGLLWTQNIIRPLHGVARVLLVLGAALTLFWVYGWHRESALLEAGWAFLQRPLFTLGGAAISPWRILVTLTIVVLVFRFGRWSRAVTYQWVFSRIGDLGVRHSLSVFTQYAIVLIGFLIVLQVIGLDLTTLTIFAGAVGVGIGFGLQTIANNFISGLLLLIERPLRQGDTVQIGTQTGEISRIGMRSLTLITWDHTEVIIPNSQVITNAFTNWTHSDRIVRTVLMVGIRYDADPHRAHALINAVLEGYAEVLREPRWSVQLWEFGDSVLTLRVQYFTDYVASSLLEVRSAVMFAIHDRFLAAGIGRPNAQRDLRITEWPEGMTLLPRRQVAAPPATGD